MAKPLDAIDFLALPQKHSAASICVAFGDDAFLQREVLTALRHSVLGEDDGEFSLVDLDGDDATLRDVLDQLSTISMFGGGRRMVIIADADAFVTKYRAELEAYAAKPRANAVLVLAPSTWPATTRLYKSIAETGLQIECKTPPPAKLLKWLVEWAKRRHGSKLESSAAEALAEIVEPELGLFDQELAKLSALAGGEAITTAMVHEAVGGWRAKTTWDMLDAAANGDAREAFEQLNRLLLAGEVPIAILGQIGSSLRRMAAAARAVESAKGEGRQVSLRQALETVGVKSFVIGKTEPQLRQLGADRAGKLYEWLLDVDLALKGSASSPHRARFELEKLIARLGRRPTAAAR